MAEVKAPIYRSEAIKKYLQSKEKEILPRFIRLPTFAMLWAGLGLLLVAMALAWLTRTPIYLSAQGIVLVKPATTSINGGAVAQTPAVVVFLPAAELSQIKSGQKVQLQLNGLTAGNQLNHTVSSLEPTLVSPAQLRQAFKLDSGEALLVTQPSGVVQVQLNPDEANLAPLYNGSLISVQVETGSKRLLAFLPLIGKLFED